MPPMPAAQPVNQWLAVAKEARCSRYAGCCRHNLSDCRCRDIAREREADAEERRNWIPPIPNGRKL